MDLFVGIFPDGLYRSGNDIPAQVCANSAVRSDDRLLSWGLPKSESAHADGSGIGWGWRGMEYSGRG